MSTPTLLHSIKPRLGVGGCPDTVAHDILATMYAHPPALGGEQGAKHYRAFLDAIIRELDGERRP